MILVRLHKVNRVFDRDEIKEIHTSDIDHNANLNRLLDGDNVKENKGDNMLQDRNSFRDDKFMDTLRYWKFHTKEMTINDFRYWMQAGTVYLK